MGFEVFRSAGAPYPANWGSEAQAMTLDQFPEGGAPDATSSVRKRTRACLACGSAFALNPCHTKEHRYCSPRCRAQHYRTEKQRALPGESRVERAFAEWIDTAAGRYVEAEVARLARDDKAAGDKRGEINLYLALVRRSSRHLTLDAQGYRCNQNHRSFLARRLMAQRPELAGFFEIRSLRGRVA